MNATNDIVGKLFSMLIWSLVLAGTGYIVYSAIYERGQMAERAIWEKREAAHLAQISRLKVDYANREGEHKTTIAALSKTLQEKDKDHAQNIARLDAAFIDRLRKSEQRALTYQRQATGTTFDSASLADHAARLDTALEEGRRLVEELGAVVRLREDELRTLGAVIQADRKLFTDLDTTNEH